MSGDSPAGTGAQSLQRALSILRTLASGPGGGVSLQDVAILTGLARPTAHRMLKALVEEGLVEQNARTRRYSIGEQIPILALARPKRPPLLQAAESILHRAAASIGDTIFLTVRTGDDAVCLARQMGSYPIQVLIIDVGARRPLGVSSAGWAILSCLAADEVAAILDRNTGRLAPYRRDKHAALRQVEDARRRGYALSDPGLVPGTKALSVSIQAGSVKAAITVAAVRQRLRPNRELELFAELRSLSSEIVRCLATAKA